MISVGKQMPEFTLIDHNGETVSLSQFFNKKNVILSVFPLAFTSG